MKRQATISSYFTNSSTEKKPKNETRPDKTDLQRQIKLQEQKLLKEKERLDKLLLEKENASQPTKTPTVPKPSLVTPTISQDQIKSLSLKFKEKCGNLNQKKLEKRQQADQHDLLSNTINPKDLTPLESQVIDLKSKYPDCLLLVEVGYKFRFFGQDAKIASRVLHIAHFVDKHFYVASIPVHRLKFHVRKLVNAGHKVGIVRQTETAALKAVSQNKSQPFQRELSELITKGTQVDELDDSETGGYLMCLVEEKKGGHGSDDQVQVGMVAIQTSTGDIIYDGFHDTFMRRELETRLLHLEPSEILLPSVSTPPTEKLIHHISQFGENRSIRLERIQSTDHDFYLNYNSALTFVTDFYTELYPDSLSIVVELPHIIIKSLACLIQYLQTFKLSNILKLSSFFQHFASTSQMLLNANTLTQLEIFRNNSDFSEKGTLFSIMNHTYTPFGKRLLKKWIGRPLIDPTALSQRTEAIQELMHHPFTFLKRLPDLEKGLARIHYGKSSPSELLQTLSGFHTVTQHTFGPFKSNLLQQLIPPPLPDLSHLIHPDYQPTQPLHTLFRTPPPDILTHLDAIHQVETQLDQHLTHLISTTHLPLQYVTVAGLDYLIQLPNSHPVPQDWIKISGTKTVSRFRDRLLLEHLQTRDQHRDRLELASQRAYQDLLSQISHHTVLRQTVTCLAQLDCLHSLAILSSQPGYHRPTFGDHLVLTQARHPILEHRVDYIPHDLELNRVLVLTGPNMGGKSSLSRSVGLLSIMGQLGCYLPAQRAQLKLLDAIYTRMGASDQLIRGQSTFKMELNETSDLLRSGTDRSLVILDELGRGTSTHDGQAIALAVLDELVKMGCFVIFVTHYPIRLEGVRHGRMDYRMMEGKVVLLYRLVEGMSFESFGLNVARMAGLPEVVVERAEVVAGLARREMEERFRIRLLRHWLSSSALSFEEKEFLKSIRF